MMTEGLIRMRRRWRRLSCQLLVMVSEAKDLNTEIASALLEDASE